MPYFAVDDDFGWVQLKVVELPEHLTYLGARNNFPHFWKKTKNPQKIRVSDLILHLRLIKYM